MPKITVNAKLVHEFGDHIQAEYHSAENSDEMRDEETLAYAFWRVARAMHLRLDLTAANFVLAVMENEMYTNPEWRQLTDAAENYCSLSKPADTHTGSE